MLLRLSPISKYAYLTAVFLLLALIFELTFSYFNTSEKYHIKKFQRTIWQKENIAQELISKAQRQLDIQPAFAELYTSCQKHCNPDEDINIFILQNDSVLFWTSSEIPLEIKGLPFENSSDTLIGNDLFLIKSSDYKSYNIIALVLIKHEYYYQNDYLVSEFQENFTLPDGTKISQERNENSIFTSDQKFLFSLDFDGNTDLSDIQVLALFFLYIAAILSLIAFIHYCYISIPFLKENKLLVFIGFTIDLIIVRALIYLFEVPPSLYNSDLFSPIHYASSLFNRSLGDALINSLFYLAYGTFIFYLIPRLNLERIKQHQKLAVSSVMIILIIVLYYFLFTFTQSLVLNSSFPLQLNNFFSLNYLSWLGLISVIISSVAFIIISYSLFRIVLSLSSSLAQYFVVALIVLLFLVPFYALVLPYDPIFLVFLLLLLIMFPVIIKYLSAMSMGFLFIILLFFSAQITFILNNTNYIKEKEFRLLLASDLVSQRDPLTEYKLGQKSDEIKSDSVVAELLNKEMSPSIEREILDYLHMKHLREFSNKFGITITLCDPDAILEINPGGVLYNCYNYFDEMLVQSRTAQIADNLYYMDDQAFNTNYLMIIPIDIPVENIQKTIYIELYSKAIPVEGLGYPDLLMDKSSDIISKLASYSIALYQDDKLVYKYGDYSYSTQLTGSYKDRQRLLFEDHKGYNHLFYPVSERNTLIISLINPTFRDLTAPFSYLFILLTLVLIIYSEIAAIEGRMSEIKFTFRTRLQFSIILIILVSFFVIGLISRSYLVNLHHKKNMDLLADKTFSVLIEVEHKLATVNAWDDETVASATTYLNKFSQVFFSDINLYDPQGTLIASSRPQVFNEGLLSILMNPEAYYRMSVENKLQFIQTENIGKQQYLSSYLPFRNTNNQVMAYLNLPYFSKQRELQAEISSFLVAFINVYVLLTVLSVIVVVIASRYITKPLELVRSKIRDVQLGKPNEKIEWRHKDEIGGLVSEYNRMIDELARSAELLARSERETAWREMAQQVAHEIKNPLTPMKLSIQHLKKAWDEKKPDYEERLKRFTETIVEQIDSLSDIATAFSDFARMPKINPEVIDLVEIAKNSIELYKEAPGVDFRMTYDASEDYSIFSDSKQLLRVFNNLIQNSIHAVSKKEHGVITIVLSKSDNKFFISIEDNGSGIPDEQKPRIFSPNFTTKSGGTGLGLAMVMSIITSMGGKISFRSTVGEGTVFFIELPQ